MNARKVLPLCAMLLVLPGLASASVKNVLSFKEGTNTKPTTIALTKFSLPSASGTLINKQSAAAKPPQQVTFEFKPGKETPAEFKPQGTVSELSVETEVNVPGQVKTSMTTVFTQVVITGVTVTGKGNDARETIVFTYATASSVTKS